MAAEESARDVELLCRRISREGAGELPPRWTLDDRVTFLPGWADCAGGRAEPEGAGGSATRFRSHRSKTLPSCDSTSRPRSGVRWTPVSDTSASSRGAWIRTCRIRRAVELSSRRRRLPAFGRHCGVDGYSGLDRGVLAQGLRSTPHSIGTTGLRLERFSQLRSSQVAHEVRVSLRRDQLQDGGHIVALAPAAAVGEPATGSGARPRDGAL